jgi:hypothetical protein
MTQKNEKRLIDAYEFRNNLRDVIESRRKAGMPWAQLKVAEIVAEGCPTVDAVEVVHGRWVRKAHDGAFGVFHLWHCSVCDTIRARQDPYCGECGAKMEVDNG